MEMGGSNRIVDFGERRSRLMVEKPVDSAKSYGNQSAYQ
jgi:hypothetical protein